ncbi:MAG: hypothetical protein ACPGPE_10050 [Planctomycetota bacterium]
MEGREDWMEGESEHCPCHGQITRDDPRQALQGDSASSFLPDGEPGALPRLKAAFHDDDGPGRRDDPRLRAAGALKGLAEEQDRRTGFATAGLQLRPIT